MILSQTNAYTIAYKYGLCPVAGTKYEVWQIPEEKAWIHVVNIANRPQNINIAIKIDSTLMETYALLESDG